MRLVSKLVFIGSLFSLITSSAFVQKNHEYDPAWRELQYIKFPDIQEVHLDVQVGQQFVLTTPNASKGFCCWRFLSGNNIISDEEGIKQIEESGCLHLIDIYHHMPKFVEFSGSCRYVNQLNVVFQAIKPGRVIFYVQNKSVTDYIPGYIHTLEMGCSCKPMIRKFVIDVKEYHGGPYLAVMPTITNLSGQQSPDEPPLMMSFYK